MKKQLLIAAGMLAVAATAQAGVDPAKYEAKEGLTCTNEWLVCRNLDNVEFTNLPWATDWDRTRTAVVVGDKIYFGYSHKVEVNGELNSGTAFLIEHDYATGAYLRTIQMTCDGEMIQDLLCANQVGVDDYGHIWFAGFVSTLANRPVTIYVVDDIQTGACHVAMECPLPEEEAEASARVDYFDLVGDITGEQARCVVMSCSCEGSENTYVYGWQRDQGSDKVEPHMDDESYVSTAMKDTYPEGMTLFNYGSMLYICRDEEHTGEQFYVDGFTTYPTLYNTTGELLSSFAVAPELRPDDAAANGALEFTIGGDLYFAYPITEYSKGPGWQYRIAKLGPNMEFEGMVGLWELPEMGLGTVSNSGMRMHCLNATPVVDENGKEGVYIFDYVCNGGFGKYLIAQEGFQAGAQDVIANEQNAPIEYFNLQGQRVDGANLQAGVYVTRQGSTTAKVIVR